jgi:hypothetical protein
LVKDKNEKGWSIGIPPDGHDSSGPRDPVIHDEKQALSDFNSNAFAQFYLLTALHLILFSLIKICERGG